MYEVPKVKIGGKKVTFVNTCVSLVPELRNKTDIFFTSESNGNSAMCCHMGFSPSDSFVRFHPNREANTSIAISVGAPRAFHSPGFSASSAACSSVARFASDAMLRYHWSAGLEAASSRDAICCEECRFSSAPVKSLGCVVVKETSPALGLYTSLPVSTEYVPQPGSQAFLTTIRPWVMVPVLSEQISKPRSVVTHL